MENMEQLRKLITEKRNSKNLARDKISELLRLKGIEYGESSLSRFENGKIKNIRIEVLNALCDILGIDKKTAFSLAGLDNKDLLYENKSFSIIDTKEVILKAYNFDSNRDGRVDFDNYVEVSLLSEVDELEELENNIAINVLGDAMQPFFFEGDNLLIKKEPLIAWGDLNRKIVFYEFENKFYLRKVLFVEGKGYLEAFNKDVYGKVTYLNQLIYGKPINLIHKAEKEKIKVYKNDAI